MGSVIHCHRDVQAGAINRGVLTKGSQKADKVRKVGVKIMGEYSLFGKGGGNSI